MEYKLDGRSFFLATPSSYTLASPRDLFEQIF
jgi:hypothetical protein